MDPDSESGVHRGEADLSARLKAHARRPRNAHSIYALGLMLHRWILEHPGSQPAEAMLHFQIERTRGQRAMRIAELPEEILNAWRDRSAITVRGGAGIAAVMLRGGSPARRLRARAAVIVRDGGMQRPEPHLLAAAADRPRRADAVDCRLYSPDDRLVGRLRYSRVSDAVLELRLLAAAPGALRDDILALLRRHALIQERPL